METIDYERVQERMELEEELKADRRFRSDLTRLLSETPEVTDAALQGYLLNTERAIRTLDHRIALLTLRLTELDGDPPAATLPAA